MSDRARLTVTTGPDRGRVFELAEEMSNIGRGTKNEIALTDLQVSEHHATLMSRNGRYAIYVLRKDSVEVDGNVIPAEQWVWLPDTARIKMSTYTGLRFQYEGTRNSGNRTSQDSSATDKNQREKSEPSALPTKPRSLRGKSAKSTKQDRKVAKFITDQGGDALVRLGEDGHLPELSLADSPTKKIVRDESAKGSSLPLVYLAVGGSLLLSVALLIVPSEPGLSTQAERAQARQEITTFYGPPNEEPNAWQRKLREARLAHSSGDVRGERRAYQQVLDMLNAEEYNQPNAPSHIALTGDRSRDEALRQIIAILLSK